MPDGGTELIGMGSFKNFSNLYNYAAPLRLHPKRLLAGDRSEDMNFPKAMPLLEGLDFSGEAVFVLPVPFTIYPDSTVNSRINYWFIGDGRQTLT